MPAPLNAEAKIRLRSGLLQRRHHLARPMRVYFLLLLPLLSPLCCIPATAAVPHIIHVSDPVRPDETVLMTGDSFGDQGIVELAQIPAEAKGPMGAGVLSRNASWQSAPPLQRSEVSLKCVIPRDWPQGIWLCRVRNGTEVSEPVVLNAPSVWWWNGDSGETASPGGWLRVFGKALAFGSESRCKLTGADGKSFLLHTEKSSTYAVKCAVPKELPEGEYTLWMHNGLGGEATWTVSGSVSVQAARASSGVTFNVRDFGPKPADALLAALEKAREAGGGTVFLPRGRYPVKDTLRIPPGTTLKGEGLLRSIGLRHRFPQEQTPQQCHNLAWRSHRGDRHRTQRDPRLGRGNPDSRHRHRNAFARQRARRRAQASSGRHAKALI